MSTIRHYALLTAFIALLSPADSDAKEPVEPVTPAEQVNLAKATLGKKLFFDPRLSKSGFISCNSCHNLSTGGVDNLPTSIGHGWQKGPINSPTVLNASLNIAQFWDGRAPDLQAQAAGPVANPKEMASTHELVVDVVASIPGYQREFALVYGADAGVTIEQVTDAIAEFENTLKTPNSAFDQWLLGDADAITEFEREGYELFKSSGCVGCHNGEGLGGSSYQRFGIIEPYRTKNPAEGRYAVTGQDSDRFSFKVPTLRNVELTYPYFHDGQVNSLEEAVAIMGRLQLGRQFSEKENAKIVAFLKTLTGEQPKLSLPILPPSSPNTPLPVPFE